MTHDQLAISTEWGLIKGLLNARVHRMLLSGPPGLGKTKTPHMWAQENGWEFCSLTLTPELSATRLEGHFVLKGNEFAWKDGVMTHAWRRSHEPEVNGVLVVLNELALAGDDIQTSLHNFLDDPDMAQVDLPNGEVVKPCPGKVQVVATMNGDPELLPQALLDRFPVRVALKTVHPDALETLPQDLRSIAARRAVMEDENRIGFRQWSEYARLRESMGEEPAARALFGVKAQDIINAIKLAGAAK